MTHRDGCALKRALAGRVECVHGYDVCPVCDKCDCGGDS